ncbi:MAG: hypothetical protein ACK5RQ_01830 [Bacteroidota bacterium]
MRKYLFTGIVACVCMFCYAAALGQSRTPSLKLTAFKRSILNGVAPSSVIKVGDEEIPNTNAPAQIEYYIYLLASRVSNLELNQVWIQQELYTATLSRVNSKSVVLENGKFSDTLVHFTKEAVWQINISEKDMTGTQPKKNIAKQVAANELVLRLSDRKGAVYTRTIKNITPLKPFAGM